MRYFLELSYLGTQYCGWQRQPNAKTVQQTIEEALSILMRKSTQIVGCGRTDAGVHASRYFAHFDATEALAPTFLRSINAILPNDIAIQNVHAVTNEAHARYDAFQRHYIYYIAIHKNPFAQETAWHNPKAEKFSIEKMNALMELLSRYEDFYPFCKSDSGLDNFRVQNFTASWEKDVEKNQFIFRVTANRFLRGMVRLLVGASVQVSQGAMDIEAIKRAMGTQTLLPKPLSAPAEGLFLCKVEYPYEL